MSDYKILAAHYQSLENEVREVAVAIPISTAYLQIIAAASLAKNFEFNLYVTSQAGNSSSFFLQPTLRGICEDLIALKYLIEKIDSADAEVLINIWMSQQTSESLKKQANFFQKNRPYQPILSKNRAESSDSFRSKLNPLKQKYGWGKDKDKPSVSHMAKACDLDEIYDYLYAATSRTVHFSPSVLFRMGWGPEKPDKPYTFSTSHFSGYYDSFNVFYGSYLFVLLCDTIKSHFQFSNDFYEKIAEIQKELNEWLRWPEMITFEEMNVPKPNILPYALSVFMSKEQTEESE